MEAAVFLLVLQHFVMKMIFSLDFVIFCNEFVRRTGRSVGWSKRLLAPPRKTLGTKTPSFFVARGVLGEGGVSTLLLPWPLSC